MKIFGRHSSRAHSQLAPVCAFLGGNGTPNESSLGWNLIHEQRVNEQWAELWFTHHNSPLTIPALTNALYAHGNDLRVRWVDTYFDLETVGKLFISHFNPAAPQLTDELVHMLDLWSGNARQVWRFGREQEIGSIPTLGEFNVNAPIPPSLANILKSGDRAAQQPILQDFFTAWATLVDDARKTWWDPSPRANLSPAWATLWHPWRSVVGDDPTDWCASVGLQKKNEAFIAVLRYSVKKACRLLMPTQLEAGYFGRHFPVPPQCSNAQGGRVVDGRDATVAPQTALPEFLHPPIPFSIDDWLASNLPVLPSGPVGSDAALHGDRHLHWSRLVREFPDTPNWMPRANP